MTTQFCPRFDKNLQRLESSMKVDQESVQYLSPDLEYSNNERKESKRIEPHNSTIPDEILPVIIYSLEVGLCAMKK